MSAAAAASVGGAAARHATIAAFGGLVLLAFALRLWPALAEPSLNWADEIFQVTEPAHRLVYGTGLVPWGFHLGARSWLLPGIAAALMEVARLFGDGPDYYVPLLAGACSLLAVAPVACCFLWCRRWFGLVPALVGGFAVAVAPELIYFGARTLSEPIAAHLLLLAIYLLDPGFYVASSRRLALGAGLLALVVVLRVQLLPAAATVALWSIAPAPRQRIGALAAGALALLSLVAVFDTLTIGYPFAPTWRYLMLNLRDGVSSSFGTAPWYWYGVAELAIWRAGLLVFLTLAIAGSRRNVLPLVVAAAVVAVHALVPHKEYRFVYPAIVLLSVQAGVGLAGLADGFARARAGSAWCGVRSGLAAAALIALAWGLLAASVWNGPALAGPRVAARDELAAAAVVAHAPGVCGIGLYEPRGRAWAPFGGYTRLHQSVPLYWPESAAELARLGPSFNVLLYAPRTEPPRPALPAGFQNDHCFGQVCLARRTGSCAAAAMRPLPFPALLGIDAWQR